MSWLSRLRKYNKAGRSGFSMTDVLALNNDVLEGVYRTPLDALQQRITKASISINELDQLQGVLARQGLVVIPDFLSEDLTLGLSEALDIVAREALSLLKAGEVYECDSVVFDASSGRFPSYQSLATYSKPVVQVRQGQDQGMIDIFNVDDLLSEHSDEIVRAFSNENINNAIAMLGDDAAPANINAYINQGIKRTRGFHVDSYSTQYKAFIYLEDVLSLDNGPYTYVLESNRESPYRSANQKLSLGLPNPTECPIVDINKIVPVLAPKGALVISDQSGFHRGFPQSETGKRKALVMNYK